MIRLLNYSKINSKNNIMVMFELNERKISIEYYKNENNFLPRFEKINDFKLPVISIEELNSVDFVLNEKKILKNFSIDKINNYFIATSQNNLGFKTCFRVFTEELNIFDFKQNLIKNKEKIFLIDSVLIKNNEIEIFNKKTDLNKYFNNLNSKEYFLDTQYLLKIAGEKHIMVVLTESDFSYQEINNDLIPCIYISKNKKERIPFILGYFLLNYFMNQKTNMLIFDNINDQEFFEITAEVFPVILPEKIISYWMDQVIIKDLGYLAKRLNISKKLLYYRLDQLNYGRN